MAKINFDQVEKIADFLKTQPRSEHLNFYSFGDKVATDMYPPLAKTRSSIDLNIKFFFLWGLHNWGFWYGDNFYIAPMYGLWRGKKVKGSELWSLMLMRAFEQNASVVEPEYLADMSAEEFKQIFSDDNGPAAWPDFDHRLRMTRNYGEFFKKDRRFGSPVDIVVRSNNSKMPLNTFLTNTGFVSGYDLDSYQKREILLAMALTNRPEKFLKATARDNWSPIIDYHLMRLALRTGMVELIPEEEMVNSQRLRVSGNTEEEIRHQSYYAFRNLILESGKSMFEIDLLFWQGRRFCKEESEPDCDKCILNSVCQQRKHLFQPIFRTDAY